MRMTKEFKMLALVAKLFFVLILKARKKTSQHIRDEYWDFDNVYPFIYFACHLNEITN